MAVAAVAAAAAAQPDVPRLSGAVNDFAGVLPEPSRVQIARLSDALMRATDDVLVVATVPSFAPYASIEEYAVKMFENGGRGIGQKGAHNGILIVTALEERKVRIEVGYGLEEIITDGFAGETIRGTILPHFREGRYDEGLYAGAAALARRIAEARHASLELPAAPAPAPSAPPRHARNRWEWLETAIPLGIIFALIAIKVLRLILWSGPRRRRPGLFSGWTSGLGGNFGGGASFLGEALGTAAEVVFSGFGGGGSGGGGASGSW